MPSRRPARRPPPAAPDAWGKWFSRVMQTVGLGVVVFEAGWERNDRPWLLLVAVAMMTGGLGLQILLRWLGDRLP